MNQLQIYFVILGLNDIADNCRCRLGGRISGASGFFGTIKYHKEFTQYAKSLLCTALSHCRH
jgi:hypothetical protein